MDERIILITPRQYEVGQLWAMGRNEQEIAKILNISHRTVQSHVLGFYQKTGCDGHSGTFDWFARNVWGIDVPGVDNSIPKSVVVYQASKFVLYQGVPILDES